MKIGDKIIWQYKNAYGEKLYKEGILLGFEGSNKYLIHCFGEISSRKVLRKEIKVIKES